MLTKTKYLPLLLLLSGCNLSDSAPQNAENNTDNTTITDVDIPEEIVQELKDQPTVDAQFGVLYGQYDHLLDRTDSLTGTDENQNGIRDDIETFINLLDVTEPVRNALMQDARQKQENLYHDFSEKTDENIDKAWEISDKYLRVIACKEYVGMAVRDMTNTSKTLTALTYNTKSRTLAYLAYNQLLDGHLSTLLDAKEEYCE
ncbi:chromosome partitioning protein ParA [Enterovibrio norvegicus]|uniref:chromosome partitioning protein ParA n=1 Tax=Enterovibrio norvegicus TaxID=188144 RepID=UPI0013D1B6B2|nr:chromosome partitioning protein ParA [Enterovibrio norvegicus]